VDLEAGTDYLAFKRELNDRLKPAGVASVLKHFLGLCFFNFVWFYTGDCFRAEAKTSESYIRELDEVELLCREAADHAWKLCGPNNGCSSAGLELVQAEAVVRAIESRVCGI
jgi:hypothetical protein